MTLPAQDIVDRLREAMDGVTPGKWERFPVDRIIDAQGGRYGVQSQNGPLVADCGEATNTYSRANAVYIALCSPDNIGALLDTISRLTADNEALRTEAEAFRGKLAEACGKLMVAEARADALAQEVERLRLPEGTLAKHGSTITIEFDNAEYALRAFDAIEYAMSREPVALANEEAGQ